jgi:hypothetical protein
MRGAQSGYVLGMSDTNVLVRSLHDTGLAAWFGGTLFGAVGLNQAAARRAGAQTAKVASEGWKAWTPVNLAAIGAHVVGATGLLVGNKSRVAAQQGVGTVSIVKTAVLGVSLAATAYSRVLGQRVIESPDVPAESGTKPTGGTPQSVAKAQRQLDVLQWALPVLTGAMVVLNAVQGEMQRPKQVLGGVLGRLTGG